MLSKFCIYEDTYLAVWTTTAVLSSEVIKKARERNGKIKKDFPELTIILNGGLKSITDCQSVLDKLDGVMIGRAAQGNPWIFNRINHYLASGLLLPEPSFRSFA
mgnify:CR=1 FL=1